ncbi:hypothetical protein GXB78_03650 [Pseudomonas moraviensis subsp. stanleyae]|uniref:hypothetical protein n=1 Tax=Pseudomonas moraviensis TaxID=321662 RepID=UPI002E31EAAD|nr:hypothetical protein [Pseudomonas moraviensis]MED7666305.1 hypothetical protein [Pseudomonas moraviensis subsp. stanleyae]
MWFFGFLVFWGHIRCCGHGRLWFRLTATHFFYKRLKKVSKKTLAPAFGPRRLGFLRCGIDPGASPPVCFAAPPLDVFGCAKRSLRSHPRINPSTQPSEVARGSRSKALELTLIVEWGGFAAGLRCFAFCFRATCGSRSKALELTLIVEWDGFAAGSCAALLFAFVGASLLAKAA